jgi:hypothetical protein
MTSVAQATTPSGRTNTPMLAILLEAASTSPSR